ncbi:DUF2612 domain-containing protein [Yersinia sp. 2545 StPb PI]|uniref:DUF2612 domain-containing protein n=1 Tax=Yersinia sp. 2545 StPb PI TaxID=3117410 RepID=UPI003FA41456
MKDYKETLLSQYANSPTITSIISTFNDAIDPETDLDNFYDFIWNVETAVGFGLDIWGKIVDIPRLLQVETSQLNLGFVESEGAGSDLTSPQPFDQAPFYEGPLATTTVALSDDAYRLLIMVKALANITDCTAMNLNKLLRYLFANRGIVFVTDTGGMEIRYVFGFDLTPVERSIVLNSTAIPRSAGVLAQMMITNFDNTFGFAEAGLAPFDQGTFFPDSGLQNAK